MRFINKTLVPRSGIKHVSMVQGFVPSSLRPFHGRGAGVTGQGETAKGLVCFAVFRGPATSAGKFEAILEASCFLRARRDG